MNSSEQSHPLTKHRDTVRELFISNPKIDVNRIDPEAGLTLFHVACEFGLVGVVEQLIARHAGAPQEFDYRPVDARDELGNTPLHLALHHDHSDNHEVVKLLLRAGADPDATNRHGSTALHAICKREDCSGNLAFMFMKNCKSVLGRAPRTDIRDKWGRTPLEWVVARRSLTPLAIVLNHSGADLSGFVFPYPNYYDENLKPRRDEKIVDFIARTRSDARKVLAWLRNRGWVAKEKDPAKTELILTRYGLTGYTTPDKFMKSQQLYAYSGPRQE